jgi:Phosphotransferase enzyme family
MTDRRATTGGASAAVSAWAAVRPAGAPPGPQSATTVKPFRGGSAVYRLGGMGPRGRDVIAKWTSRATVELEAGLYADVLSRLPVPTVRCYGIAPDDDEAMAWLFLEDAGGVPYSPERPEHRRLAARWLAGLHATATGGSAPAALSTRDAAHYRDLLERCRRTITAGLGNPALAAEHQTSLRAVVRRSEMLLDRWPAVERICAALPRTLVHADFVAKNVRITERPTGRTLVAFDWENAGWGPPAIDLPSVDLDEYAREIGGGWPLLPRSELATVARIGRIFWFASCVDWESWAIATESVSRLSKNMPVYERDVAVVMAELGWA